MTSRSNPTPKLELCPICSELGKHNDLCEQAFRDALPVVCVDCRHELKSPLDSGEHACAALETETPRC